MKKVLILLALVGSASALNAVTITYSARANSRPVDVDGNFLIDGALVRLGTFTAGFDFATNGSDLNALLGAYTPYHESLTTLDGSRSGSINNVTFTTSGIAGKQLYMWIFNGATTASTQWGIFTNSTWIAAGDEAPSDTTGIGLSNPGLQALVGSTNTISGTVSGKLALVAVPEPSTYALMGLGLVVVGFMARRRK